MPSGLLLLLRGFLCCTEFSCSPSQPLLLGQEAPRPQGSSGWEPPAGSPGQSGPGRDSWQHPWVHQAAARATPRASPHPCVSSTHLSAGLCEVHFAFPAKPLFPFSATARGNTASKDERPRPSSPARPSEHSRVGHASAFPDGELCREAMGGRGEADAHAQPAPPPADHHCTSSALSCRSHFTPSLLSPSLPPGGDTGQAGGLPSPSLPGRQSTSGCSGRGRGCLARTPKKQAPSFWCCQLISPGVTN